MIEHFVLDACALIAVLDKEDGYVPVEDLMVDAERGSVGLFMHIVNLFEVCYHRTRKNGFDDTAIFLDLIQKSPIQTIDMSCDNIFRQAQRFKLAYSISLADSFALASAHCMNARLVTCDHHEFDPIAADGHIDFLWIR